MKNAFASRFNVSSKTFSLASLLAIISFNIIILYYQDVSFLSDSACKAFKNRVKKHAHYKRRIPSPRNVRKLTSTEKATEEHDWKSEQESLEKILPVVELSAPSRRKEDSPTFVKVLKSIDDRTFLSKALSRMEEMYWRRLPSESLVSIFNDGKIFSCHDIDKLEKSSSVPFLKQDVAGNNLTDGVLHISKGISLPTTTYVLKRNATRGSSPPHVTSSVEELNIKTFKNSDEEYFSRGMEELNKLLEMQGLEGIPRIYGACIMGENGNDVMLVKKDKEELTATIRYVVQRFDNATPLCKSASFTDKCLQLESLAELVKNHSNPLVVGIKLMYGFTKIFFTLSKNGIFPLKIYPNDLVITKNYDVVFTTVNSFLRLTSSHIKNNSYERFLSEMTCKEWYECPTPRWQRQHILSQLGQDCIEVRGFCSSANRCWGMDAETYVCVLSKWIFSKLECLMPSAWEYAADLHSLLSCGRQGMPRVRCGWQSFASGLNKLLHFAEKKFNT